MERVLSKLVLADLPRVWARSVARDASLRRFMQREGGATIVGCATATSRRISHGRYSRSSSGTLRAIAGVCTPGPDVVLVIKSLDAASPS